MKLKKIEWKFASLAGVEMNPGCSNCKNGRGEYLADTKDGWHLVLCQVCAKLTETELMKRIKA